MITVGLTGGIGSGKSTIAGFFKAIGIPVYNADSRAKQLMLDPGLMENIKKLLGNDSYTALGQLDRVHIAALVFNDNLLLDRLNGIVHPAVADDFKRWCLSQDSPYVVKEAAILFENGNYDTFDYTILVTAPKEVRLMRVMKRDGVDKKKVLSRMNNQWEDEKKIPLADFIIHNLDLKNSEKEVRKIHVKILRSLTDS